MIRVRTKSIELMTTEISAWECELKTKETEPPESVTEETTEKKTDEVQPIKDTAASSIASAATTTSASATNTPKKQKLVHFNKN